MYDLIGNNNGNEYRQIDKSVGGNNHSHWKSNHQFIQTNH